MPTRAGLLSAYVPPGTRSCDRPCVSSTTRSVGKLIPAGDGGGKKNALGRRSSAWQRADSCAIANPPAGYRRGSIVRLPIQATSGSGTVTVPSAFWWFSRIAIIARLIATAVPLRVWTNCVPFSPGLR
jgi:hypothetical protein